MSEVKALKSNFLWNSGGYIFYLFTQWLLTIIIVKIDNGYVTAGLLAQCMAIGNIGLLVAGYNIRSYQVSDIDNKFAQSDYFSHRIINSVITVFAAALFCFAIGYDFATGAVVTAYVLFKITEAFADMYYGVTQKNDRMDYIGKSHIIKGISTFIAFVALYYVSADLLLAVFGMFLVSMLIIFLYDHKNAKLFAEIKIRFSKKTYLSLLSVCFSPFFYGICICIIPAIPRLYLEQLQGKEVLGIYASIATPAVLVQVGISFLFMPLVTLFTRYYREKDKKFIKLYVCVMLIIAVIGLFATLAVRLIGEPILVFLFNQGIAEYSRIFTTTVINSFLTGLIWFLFMLLTIMRKMKTIFIGSAAGVIAVAAATIAGIPMFGIDGVNYVLFIAYALMGVFAFAAVTAELRRAFSASLS